MIQSDIVWLWGKLESTFPTLGMLLFFTVVGGFILKTRVPWLFKLLFGKRKHLEEGEEEIDEETAEHHHHKRRRRSDAVIDKFIDLAKEQNKFQEQQIMLMKQLADSNQDMKDLLSSMAMELKAVYDRELRR